MSCQCFLNHSPLNKRECQSIPLLRTCFQLAFLTQYAVIHHFNMFYFCFHWRRLKIFNLLNFGNKHFQYRHLKIMCIDPYIVKFSITMHRCTDGSSHPYLYSTCFCPWRFSNSWTFSWIKDCNSRDFRLPISSFNL